MNNMKKIKKVNGNKNYVIGLVMLAIIFLSSCSPEQEVVVEKEINASADAVWAILAGDFAGIADWASILEKSEKIKHSDLPENIKVDSNAPVPGRKTYSGKFDVIEVLTSYSDENRSFTFQAVGLPKFIVKSQNTTSVTPVSSNTCIVKMHIQMELKGMGRMMGGKMGKRFNEMLNQLFLDLDNYASSKHKAPNA